MQSAPGIAIPSRSQRSLASLIALYESNYYRFLRLAPELGRLEGTVVSRVAGALDLYLTVHGHDRYTTTLSLTYRFEREGLQPNACIAVYHDVRAAELTGYSRRRQWRAQHGPLHRRMPDLDRKWQLNRFLQRWLGFCHRQGHLFLRVTARPVELPPDPGAGAERELPAGGALR